MPGIQPAAAQPHGVEGSPETGGQGSAAGTAPARQHQMSSQTGQLPHICWGRPAETLHQASGFTTASIHLLHIQDDLISDPQMGLFTSFSSVSLLHVNAWTGSFLKKGSRKLDIVFISFLEQQGKIGEEGTILCSFSDVSTANMQCPENPLPQPTPHKLSCTETHPVQPSLYRKQSLERRNLLLGASLFQIASANGSHHSLQRAAMDWKRAPRYNIQPAALAF